MQLTQHTQQTTQRAFGSPCFIWVMSTTSSTRWICSPHQVNMERMKQIYAQLSHYRKTGQVKRQSKVSQSYIFTWFFLGMPFLISVLYAKRRRRSNFLNALSLSADGSRHPSGSVGPNEKGSTDPQSKCPHGTTKSPWEQVWRKYQQLSRSCIQPSSMSNISNYLDFWHIFLFMEDETFACAAESFAPKIRQNFKLKANVK